MKILVLLLLIFNILNSADSGVKNSNIDVADLFKQIDSAISKKETQNDESDSFEKIDKDKREQNYLKFNQAAKKYHIFRAKKILIVLKKLIKQHEASNGASLDTIRYAKVGEKVFAYVSNVTLNKKVHKLEVNHNILKNLYQHKELLENIDDFDIKTITKVLIKLEQEILNINGLGKRKITKFKNSKDLRIVRLRLNEKLDDIKVFYIDKNTVKLKSILR